MARAAAADRYGGIARAARVCDPYGVVARSADRYGAVAGAHDIAIQHPCRAAEVCSRTEAQRDGAAGGIAACGGHGYDGRCVYGESVIGRYDSLHAGSREVRDHMHPVLPAMAKYIGQRWAGAGADLRPVAEDPEVGGGRVAHGRYSGKDGRILRTNMRRYGHGHRRHRQDVDHLAIGSGRVAAGGGKCHGNWCGHGHIVKLNLRAYAVLIAAHTGG